LSANASRRSVLGNVLNGLESLAEEPAVLGNVLCTIRVDVTHFTAGVACGVGVGLWLPTGVAMALLSKARSQRIRRVGTRLIARVVVQTRVILITVAVDLVVVARGTVVRVGIARIAIRFALVGRILIPMVLAKDIHGLVDGVWVLFLAVGVLGRQSSQK